MSESAYGQVSEAELSSASFDQPPSIVRSRVFICSAARTGSWLLCRAMLHRGIGIPHEYYNAIHTGVIASRMGLGPMSAVRDDARTRRAYANALINLRTVNGVFSAKIHWYQYESFLNNPEGDWLLQDAHFIHLYREDLLAQAISCHIAKQTGRWGLGANASTRPAETPRFFDLDLIEKELKALADAEANWRLFFAHNGISPLRISYERLATDLPGVMREMVDRFGLDVPESFADYVDPGPEDSRDASVPSRSKIRAMFERAHQRVRPASTADGRPDGGDRARGMSNDPNAAPEAALNESFTSLYRAAKLKARRGEEEDLVIEAFRAAQRVDATRAEALHGAARFCRERKRFQQGFELAKRALAMEAPADGVSAEGWIYDYGLLDEYSVCAYWIGRYEDCLTACRQILGTSRLASPADRARIEANSRFAEERLRDPPPT